VGRKKSPIGDEGIEREVNITVRGVLGFSCFLILASCTPASTSPPTRLHTHPASPIPTPVPTARPFPVSTSTPFPTPTTVPTLDHAVVEAAVAKVRARLRGAGVEPLCLRWEDSDDDGEPEWLGLYLQPGEPPRLMAFILDGEVWHELRPLEEHKLGEHPTCELEVRDVNADGRVEILVWGHAGASTDLLHIFAWNGTSYALLAPFEGEAGVRLENADGDLADEIAVGYDAGRDLVWEAVYTWDGGSYGWTWERYSWFYLDRPHVYRADSPEHAVIYFYLAVDDSDLPGAYDLLSAEAQAKQPIEGWMAGFATTVGVEVGSVHELSRSGNTAAVVAQLRAYDNVDGRIIAALWDVEWTVVQTASGWRLDSVVTERLDQWEAVYYD